MSNEELINNLVLDGYLKTPRIIQALRKIDRADFMPEKYKNSAYVNEPLPIGENQTISQPLTVAFMLELLEPKAGEKILDIGAGSGWQSALLAYIVSQPPISESSQHLSASSPHESAGCVVAVERILKLKALAEKNISKYGFTSRGIVKVIWKNATGGVPEEAPFDKIIAAASAEAIPEAWKSQLKVGGRLVAPVKNSIVVLDKVSETEFKEKEYYGFSFVPLVVD